MQDAARQEVAARADILVHPASFYIAARLDPGTLRAAIVPGASGSRNIPGPSAYFLNAGNPATLQWALVAPNGNAPSSGVPSGGELSIQLIRHEWKQRQVTMGLTTWDEVEEIIDQRSVRINPQPGGFVSGVFSFTPDKSGLWELRLRSGDSRGRASVTSLRFYVSGSGLVRWGSADAISLSTERQSYAPGETARILVRSPLEKGSYLLTLEREGIISHRIIELDGSVRTIDIPVEESYIPVVYATLSSYTVRSGQSENISYDPDPDKPKGIFGVTPIYVDHASHNYQIEIESPKAAYRPAEQAEITVKVLLNGKPAANTELIFMAVDRGVLDLIDYHVPDPAAFFYDSSNFPLGVRGADSRSLLIDQVRNDLSEIQFSKGRRSPLAVSTRAFSDTRWEGTGFNGAGADENNVDENEPWLQERKDFRPMAVFEPNLVTGSDGTATVKFKLPDSLTTYRLTASAIGQRDFGIKEQDIRVSAPLTAITALPRKLRWRDTGTVSLILTNLEKTPVEAQVSLETSVIEVDGDSAKSVRIGPGASEEVTFRVAALETGVARLVFTLHSPQVNERITRTLLVDRPA